MIRHLRSHLNFLFYFQSRGNNDGRKKSSRSGPNPMYPMNPMQTSDDGWQSVQLSSKIAQKSERIDASKIENLTRNSARRVIWDFLASLDNIEEIISRNSFWRYTYGISTLSKT